MNHVQTNLSKEIGLAREWRNGLWSRRYDSIVVSNEPEEQWRRLKYILAHGVKEGLVENPLRWPGVHAARPLVEGGYLEGTWFNRTKEWAARRRGEKYELYDYATKYRVGFEPLPCFRHLSPEEYRTKVASLIEEIVQEEEEEKRGGDPVAGVIAVLRQDPRKPPTAAPPKRSPRPRFHAATPQGYKELWAQATDFEVQFREAAEALRVTRPGAGLGFPRGCYPPALPFVGDPAPPCPPSPPTRRIVELESGEVFRGEVPVVKIPGSLTLEPHPEGQDRSRSPSWPPPRGEPPTRSRPPPRVGLPDLGA